ncbi:MAG: GNAT family N-acetyltransferase [Candidatus Cloacimonetes bacterium]|nr:GNAT family N-acetyltransferase [Candidatus Cloacimonadota bacterium]
MNDIKYEIVKSADPKAILALYRQAGWWETDDNPEYLNTVARIVSDTYCFVVARLGDELIGMGRAISDGCSDAYIQDVTVSQEHRGRGIGKAIIRKLLEHLKTNNLQWIGLICEPGYEKFYQSLGFKIMPNYTPFLYSSED